MKTLFWVFTVMMFVDIFLTLLIGGFLWYYTPEQFHNLYGYTLVILRILTYVFGLGMACTSSAAGFK
jgi:hypothetical protein